MALMKCCPLCDAKIDYKSKYCIDCNKIVHKTKAENNRAYDKDVRQHANIYASKIWHRLREQCKAKYNGLDIYSYYVLGRVEYGSLSHHVIPVEDDEGMAYDLDNLLYVSRATHDLIHTAYNKSDKDKKDMQDILFRLIARWEDES